MADGLGLGIDTAGLAGTAMNIAIFLAVGLVVAAIIGFLAYLYMNKKRYDEQGFKVIIYSQDGFGQIIQREDKASIFVDKITKNKRLFIKKAKIGLEADNFPYTMGSKGEKTVYLLQTGLKNFRFIRVNIDVPKVNLKVGEEDVNWALNEFDKAIKMFDSKDMLMQYMPYIIIAFVSIIILVIFIYFFKDFDKLVTMSANFKDAMIAGANAQTGTIVMGG